MMTGILWRFVSFGTIELAVHTCTLWTLLTWKLLKQIKKKKKKVNIDSTATDDPHNGKFNFGW